MTRDIVVINGWGMAKSVWQGVAPALDGYAVRYVDLDEVLNDTEKSLAAAAVAVARLAAARCHVIGWSLGAQLALQWAHARPEQVATLALVAATPCFVQQPDWQAGMERIVFDDFAAQFERDAPQALGRFALLQARGDAQASCVGRRLRGATSAVTMRTKAALQSGLELLRTTDLRPMLHDVRQPVYLAHGANDALVPLAAAQRLQHGLQRARLQVFPSAGHAPHVSQAAGFGARFADFIHEQ